METVQYPLLSIPHIQNFILGGNSNFIIRNKNNEHHINFIVKQVKIKLPNKEIELTDNYNVYYKSHSKILIGFINKPTNVFHPNKSISKIFVPETNTFNSLHNFIYNRNMIPNNIEILYTGHCCKCGKLLTDPKYIEIGIGKWCLENAL